MGWRGQVQTVKLEKVQACRVSYRLAGLGTGLLGQVQVSLVRYRISGSGTGFLGQVQDC